MASKKVKLTSQTAWETEKDLNDNFAGIDERFDALPTKTSEFINDGDGSAYQVHSGYESFSATSDYVGYYVLVSDTYTKVTNANKDSLDIVAGTTIAYEYSPFATQEYVDEFGGKIDSISVNGTPQTIDNNKNVDITMPTKLTDLTNDGNFVQDASYVHTDNNYTTEEKTKLGGIAAGAQVNVIETVKVNNNALTPSNKAVNIDLTSYSVITETGAIIDLEINSTNYQMVAKLKDKNGTLISTSSTIDLPLESIVIGAQYYATYTYDGTTYTKVIVITLATTDVPVIIPVGDLVSGLQSEITSQNKLDSDLVDDTNQTNKFVTASDKTAWNAKYDKPANGIPSTDLEESYYLASNPSGYTKVESSTTNGNIKIDNTETTVYTSPLQDISFTSDDNRWGSVDSNGFYTLTITSAKKPFAVYNSSGEQVLAGMKYDGTYIYIITDTKFAGVVSVR